MSATPVSPDTNPPSHTCPEARPERATTDESLRTERLNADAVLADKRSADEAADVVVNKARGRADAILDRAREKSDGKLEAVGSAFNKVLQEVVEQERAQEDSLLTRERAAADARLRQEREQQVLLMLPLLLPERERTDGDLLAERGLSDEAIANRDDFLGMVSHDLRGHLNSISLDAISTKAQASDSEEGRRIVEIMARMQRHAMLMAQIVDDLIDLVGINAGKLVIRPKSGDASLLLTEAAASFQSAAAMAGISLVIENSGQPLRACFDYQRMLQVLSNFLSNAIKFTGNGGRIVLRGECEDELLRLSVADTGSGIPPHLLEAVFERFWQKGKNDKRGLGLGLYISRCIVEGHRGAIRIESKLGHGSTFIATIPCLAQPDGGPT